jgi:hypothetical protein
LILLRPVLDFVGLAMGLFTQLFGDLVAFVYHCFDRIVILGYLTGLSRPDQVAHFLPAGRRRSARRISRARPKQTDYAQSSIS